MSEGIASKPPMGPSASKYITLQQNDPPNTWILAAVSGGVLLLYSLSRIIALQRRVRDLESRPPVDDIVMRGMIRQQVSEMVNDLEQSIRARNSILKSPSAVVPFATASVGSTASAGPTTSASDARPSAVAYKNSVAPAVVAAATALASSAESIVKTENTIEVNLLSTPTKKDVEPPLTEELNTTPASVVSVVEFVEAPPKKVLKKTTKKKISTALA